MSGDPNHPEAWRQLRDLSDEEWDGHLTDADIQAGHEDIGDRYRDPDGHAAMRYSRERAAMREGRL